MHSLSISTCSQAFQNLSKCRGFRVLTNILMQIFASMRNLLSEYSLCSEYSLQHVFFCMKSNICMQICAKLEDGGEGYVGVGVFKREGKKSLHIPASSNPIKIKIASNTTCLRSSCMPWKSHQTFPLRTAGALYTE
jgi:hypothetical protein